MIELECYNNELVSVGVKKQVADRMREYVWNA